MEKLTRIQAIKRFFEGSDGITPLGGRKVETSEFKGLTAADRDELGKLCATALDVELIDALTKN